MAVPSSPLGGGGTKGPMSPRRASAPPRGVRMCGVGGTPTWAGARNRRPPGGRRTGSAAAGCSGRFCRPRSPASESEPAGGGHTQQARGHLEGGRTPPPIKLAPSRTAPHLGALAAGLLGAEHGGQGGQGGPPAVPRRPPAVPCGPPAVLCHPGPLDAVGEGDSDGAQLVTDTVLGTVRERVRERGDREWGRGWDRDGTGMRTRTGMAQGWHRGGTGMRMEQGWHRDEDGLGTGMGKGWDRDEDRDRDGTGMGMGKG